MDIYILSRSNDIPNSIMNTFSFYVILFFVSFIFTFQLKLYFCHVLQYSPFHRRSLHTFYWVIDIILTLGISATELCIHDYA